MLIYIDNKLYKLGRASYLINAISKFSYSQLLNKTLVFSKINIAIMNLYKKYKFDKIGNKIKYYLKLDNIRNGALFFEINKNG